MFSGFTISDCEAFQEHKWKSPDFNEERAVVYEKMSELRDILIPHMHRLDLRFSGKIARSHIYRPNQKIDSLWLSFIITDSRKYIHLPQLHVLLHGPGVFVGLGIPVKIDVYKTNLAKWLMKDPEESLKMLHKLNLDFAYLLAAGSEWDAPTLDSSDIESIGRGLINEAEWTSWGEFYYSSEDEILRKHRFAGQALTVFRKVYPVFRIAMGFSKYAAEPIQRPNGKKAHTKVVMKHSTPPPKPPVGLQNRVEYDSKGSAIVRNPKVVEWVKNTEESMCQVCGKTILLPNGEKSIDIHHIWPLGSPHGGYELGCDCVENAICLCPNHHREMDLGVFCIDSDTLGIEYHNTSYRYDGKKLRMHPDRKVSSEYLDYHRDYIYNSWENGG